VLELTKQFFAQKGGACFPRSELHFQLDVAQVAYTHLYDKPERIQHFE